MRLILKKFELLKECILRFCTLLFVSMGLFFASCQSNQSVDVLEDRTELTIREYLFSVNEENFISEEDVRCSVSSIFNEVLRERSKGAVVSKSNSLGNESSESSNRTIRDIYSFNDVENVPAFYAVNFDNSGFIIVPADKRAPEYLAFSETGSFFNPDLDESEIPYGLTLWLEDIKKMTNAVRYNCEIIPNENYYNDDNNHVITYPNDVIAYPNDITTRNAPPSNAPFLTKTTWGQRNGYNDSLANCSPSEKIAAGCTTVALAQLIKYHQYPNNFNWSSMPNSSPSSETASLYKFIVSKTAATPNGCTSTSTIRDCARRTLAHIGFTNTDYGYYSLSILVVRS